ncbi:MAG: methionine--tRNA ligase [Deltaproteobacteria bacterium]|nr:methionine--tRNA ligase [Deltaproteobacteria bacterium]
MGRFYVTTPIYYVNDVPHLGTAYTTVVTDALRRFHQVIGDETFMLTGTDEHGQKIEREAKKQGIEPKAFCDDISKRFRDAWPKLDITADRFIRTTDGDHEAFVAELWKKIEANGDLYEGDYEGWYCVGCESLKTEKELEPGNICPLHKAPVERVKEKSYFFRLEKWQGRLLDFYARHPDFIQPATRRNEVLSFVQSGLKDLSVSRTTFTWGIPVPNNPKHVMYVWFDALSNYRSALGDGTLSRFWAPNAKVVHLVGKDILRFHTVFWPAFLLAAGYKEEELPDVVYAHGFLTVDGQKMSKTLRNAVDPLRLAETLGPDTLRYHLLRAIAFGQDGDFDHAALLERYNADLGKNVGNLLNRVLGLCVKNTEGKHPDDDVTTDGPFEAELGQAYTQCVSAACQHWKEIAPHLALEQVMKLSSAANTYVDRTAPWNELKNGNLPRLRKILSRLLRVLEAISVMLWPAMPTKADAMRAQLGLPPVRAAVGVDIWPTEMPSVRAGLALAPAGPLFPTYDDKAQAELLAKLAPPKEAAEPAPAAPAKPAAAPAAAPAGDAPATITYDDFAKIDLRVGVVKTCEKVPKKDKLLRLTVDLGEAEPRTIVAGLALSFQPDQLVGRKVLVVANLAPREFGSAEFPDADGKPKKVKLVSHGMLLASGPSEDLRLATIDGDAAPGARLK